MFQQQRNTQSSNDPGLVIRLGDTISNGAESAWFRQAASGVLSGDQIKLSGGCARSVAAK
jgi:hypothetical protein